MKPIVIFMRPSDRSLTGKFQSPDFPGDTAPEEPFDEAMLSEMAASFYEDNRRIRIDKLKRELGFVPLYPTYREGLLALAAAGEGRA